MISLDWNPSKRTLRQFAGIAAGVLLGLAGWILLRGGDGMAPWVLAGLGATAALFGWLRPAALRLVFVLSSLAVRPIGFVVSHAILLVLFYGIITPLGVLARAVRPDPLRLRRDPAATSYWSERRRPTDKASYLRQA